VECYIAELVKDDFDAAVLMVLVVLVCAEHSPTVPSGLLVAPSGGASVATRQWKVIFWYSGRNSLDKPRNTRVSSSPVMSNSSE